MKSKTKIETLFIIILTWMMAAALVYIAYEKFRVMMHK
jgi:hypothetical protein